jgi:hypothetical protein
MTDQVDLSGEAPEAGAAPQQKYLNVRQAAFIGVGAMVGAGICARLGAAGAVARAAVWLSFLIAGIVAGRQGYSFAKLGARYPTAVIDLWWKRVRGDRESSQIQAGH